MASTAAKYLTLLRRGGYLSTILSTGPVALWPLSETSGTTAVDVVGGLNGTYNNVTLNAATFPDGTGAPAFNGTTSYVDIYSAGLNTVFNIATGTALIWAKQTSGEQDANERQFFAIGVDGNNIVRAFRASSTTLRSNYYANAVYKFASVAGNSDTNWLQIVTTWDVPNDRTRLFVNGVQQGADTTGLGAWVGALSSGRCYIGATTSNSSLFLGKLKYAALWNRALTPAEVATLYVAGFAI